MSLILNYLFFKIVILFFIFGLPSFYVYIFYIEIIFYITHLFELMGYIIIIATMWPGFFRYLKEEEIRFFDANARTAKIDKRKYDKFLDYITEEVASKKPEAIPEYIGYLYSSYRSVRLIWHYKIFLSWKDYCIWMLVSTFFQLFIGSIIFILKFIVGIFVFLWYFLSYDKFVADVKLLHRRADYYFNWFINFWTTHIFELVDDNIVYTEWVMSRNSDYNMQMLNIRKNQLRILYYHYIINPIKLIINFVYEFLKIFFKHTKTYFRMLRKGTVIMFFLTPSYLEGWLFYFHNDIIVNYIGYCNNQFKKSNVSKIKKVYYKTILNLFYYVYIKLLRIPYLKLKEKLKAFNNNYKIIKKIKIFFNNLFEGYRKFRNLFSRDREYKLFRLFKQYRPYYDRFYQEKYKYTYDFTFKIKNKYFYVFFKWFFFIWSIWFTLFILNYHIVSIMINDKFWHFYYPYISFAFIGFIYYFIYLKNKKFRAFLDSEVCHVYDDELHNYFSNSSNSFIIAAILASSEEYVLGDGADEDIEERLSTFDDTDEIDHWIDDFAGEIAAKKGYNLYTKDDFKKLLNKRLWVFEGPYEDYRDKLEFLDTLDRFNYVYWTYCDNQFAMGNLSPFTKLNYALYPDPCAFVHRPELFAVFAWLWSDFYQWMDIDKTYPRGDGWEHIDHFILIQILYYIWIEMLKFKHPDLMFPPIWK